VSTPMVTAEQLNPTFLEAFRKNEENKALGVWTEGQFRKIKDARLAVERQWYINLSFYFGKQYTQFVNATMTNTGVRANNFLTPKAPPWRVRMTVNRVRPIIRTEIAKLTANRPSVYVVPATSEEQDKSAARAGEQIWNSAYRDHNINKVLRRALWWGTICGNAFIKEYWDQSAGPVQQVNPKLPAMPIGDVKFEIVTPFHIGVPDLLCEDIEDQPYLIHSTVKDVNYVQRTYGVTVNPSASTDAIIETQYMNILGDANVNNKDTVLCHEVWIKPGGHPLFPNGGMLTVIDSKVVQRIDQFPYPHGEYPFSKFDHVQSGKFYSDSIITDLVPLQRELNRTRSQVIESKNLMSKPQLLAPRGSIQARKITSEPGQVIEYAPGFTPPTPLPVQNLPSYVLQEIDRLVSDMDDISGQHEISRGQNPSQVTAYSALSYLQEQDESKLASSAASVEEFVEKLARLYLQYVVSYWDVPRMVRVVGRDKMIDAAQWKGSQIKGNTDIRVEAGSAIPQGKQQRQSFLLDLFKLGALPPEMLFELLEMNDLADANEEFITDKHQAVRENMLMMEQGDTVDIATLQPTVDPVTGQELPPQIPQMFTANSYDNHAAHVQYHNNYRKSQEFALASDTVKTLFEMHVNMHQQALMLGYAPTAGSVDGQPQEVIPPEGQPQDDPNADPNAAPGGETATPSNTQPPEQGN
jgi:Bacteriophage head to tail connecting protein